jgi:protein tyrosine phosphatase (PTP) superfamily phosphohydrolase (DUF442 family)
VFRLVAWLLIAIALVGCSGEGPSNRAHNSSPGAPFPEMLFTKHLPNALRLHDKVISGGEPKGEPAFRELQSLGVKTVISVDGARPNSIGAKKYGLRYVHLPHGYDGISEERVKELAKAVRDLEGPIYIHCHHGKHRSPVAAAVACVASGLCRPEDAVPILKAAGTSREYRGLYESADSARRLDDELLDQLHVEFRETADIPPMAESMVALERTHHQLTEIASAGWKAPAAHPDLDPAHEALLMREHFTEFLRSEEVQEQPERFRQLMRESESAARTLELGLRESARDSDSSRDFAPLVSALQRVTQNCTACHREFRDVPLREKPQR